LRYVELNPVRAGMVSAPEEWPWSSATAHCNPGASGTMLDMEYWQKRWTASEWSQYLAARESPTDLDALRQCTHTGRPLGPTEFVAGPERTTLRTLAPRKGGRPKKARSRFPTGRPRSYCLARKLGNVPSVAGFIPGFICPWFHPRFHPGFIVLVSSSPVSSRFHAPVSSVQDSANSKGLTTRGSTFRR
jgi:hypothetical protein